MPKSWVYARTKSARTAFGDIDISGHFAAGRDINVRSVTIAEAVLGKSDTRIRKKILTKVLPAWLNEGDYWEGAVEVEFPVAAEFSTDQVSHRRPDINLISESNMVKRWPNVDVGQAVDRSSGKLLILGDPGSGKTRSLHQVMHLAIERALRDDQDPIPFYLHLSDWSSSRKESSSRKDMRTWFTRSIRENYGILPRMFERWLDCAEVMVVLDGLDELRLRERRECISAINRFVSEYPAVQVVVACRLSEYRDTGRKLNLRASLLIEKIEDSVISEIIDDAGGGLGGLNQALGRDKRLRDLLRNPLFFRLAISLYSEVGNVDLSSSTDRRKGLLAAYVDYAERRMESSGIQADRWLYFMARALRGQQRVTFCPDRQSVEFLPIQFKGIAEKRILLMASLFVAVPSFLLRGVMVLLAPDSPTKAMYLAITLMLPLSYGLLAWKVVKDDLWAPLAGRKTSVVRASLLFAKRSLIVCLVEGGAAWVLVTSGAASSAMGGLALLLMVLVAIWPALQMARESDTSDPSELPDRVGGEIRSLVRAAVVVTSLVTGSTYITLTVIFGALNPVPVVGEGLLYSPMLNAFFFVAPIALIAALRNGGVDLIRRYQCRRIMIQFGYLPKSHKAAFEAVRRSSLLVPRRGTLEFRHALIRDYLSERFRDDVNPLSFVFIRSD